MREKRQQSTKGVSVEAPEVEGRESEAPVFNVLDVEAKEVQGGKTRNNYPQAFG